MTSSSPPPLFLRDPAHLPPDIARPVVVIGNFDGVHKGHEGVIAKGCALAQSLRRPCAILTFEPHPADFFAQKPTIFRLTPEPMKRLALARLQPDGILALTFNAAMAELSADEFIEKILVQRLNVTGVVVGFDFQFGKGRAGTPELLQEAGQKYGFHVEIVHKISIDTAHHVRSTPIRSALEQGDVAHARFLLGRPWSIRGEIIHGQKLGRILGFPTANMETDPSCRLRYGIYAVKFLADNILYDGVASYGRRPTFGQNVEVLETYIFDFTGDLYGKMGEVFFIEWVRGEEKFAHVDALVVKIHEDVHKAREILKVYNNQDISV